MRKVIILTILALINLFAAAQIKNTFTGDNDTASMEEIKKLEFTLADLLEKGDIKTYSGYLTDDYIRISANGEQATKEQVLKGFGKSPGGFKMYPHDFKVKIYGNTAIMHAKLDLETKSGDTITKRSSLITKVFIKREGKWFMASMQGTAVK